MGRTHPNPGDLHGQLEQKTSSPQSGRVPPLVAMVESAPARQGHDLRGRPGFQQNLTPRGAVATEPQAATVDVVVGDETKKGTPEVG